MIYCNTVIDTITLQLNFGIDNNRQRLVQVEMLEYINKIFNSYIHPVEYIAGFDKRIEHKIYCNGRTVVSFKTGYSHDNYFITIKFAGLKTYDAIVDETSSNYLWVIVAYINTRQLNCTLAELDIAIDVYDVDFENLLVVCTSHTSGTKYHRLGELQHFDGQTTYIERFDDFATMYTALKRSYTYDKTLKEQVMHNNILGFNLQRFEIKLNASYFNKYGFDIKRMQDTLSMYHLMYFDTLDEKYALIDRYNGYKSGVRKREIDRMGFDNYRLYHDMDTINNFIYMLTHITNDDIFGNFTF